MQFSYTTFLNLVKPAKAATGWADAVNGNFDALDSAIGALAMSQACGSVVFENESEKDITFVGEGQQPPLAPYFDPATGRIASAAASADYAVSLTPDGNVTCWVTGKTAEGFTINLGSTFTGRIDWTASAFFKA